MFYLVSNLAIHFLAVATRILNSFFYVGGCGACYADTC